MISLGLFSNEKRHFLTLIFQTENIKLHTSHQLYIQVTLYNLFL